MRVRFGVSVGFGYGLGIGVKVRVRSRVGVGVKSGSGLGTGLLVANYRSNAASIKGWSLTLTYACSHLPLTYARTHSYTCAFAY